MENKFQKRHNEPEEIWHNERCERQAEKNDVMKIVRQAEKNDVTNVIKDKQKNYVTDFVKDKQKKMM